MFGRVSARRKDHVKSARRRAQFDAQVRRRADIDGRTRLLHRQQAGRQGFRVDCNFSAAIGQAAPDLKVVGGYIEIKALRLTCATWLDTTGMP